MDGMVWLIYVLMLGGWVGSGKRSQPMYGSHSKSRPAYFYAVGVINIIFFALGLLALNTFLGTLLSDWALNVARVGFILCFFNGLLFIIRAVTSR